MCFFEHRHKKSLVSWRSTLRCVTFHVSLVSHVKHCSRRRRREVRLHIIGTFRYNWQPCSPFVEAAVQWFDENLLPRIKLLSARGRERRVGEESCFRKVTQAQVFRIRIPFPLWHFSSVGWFRNVSNHKMVVKIQPTFSF